MIIYPESFDSPWDIFKVWQGGLISYGGFFLAGFLALVYLKINRLSIDQYLDLSVPPIALAIAITRLGCFLNHCHLGKITDLPWGLNYLSEVRHPIALYYSLSALIILIILLIVQRITNKNGVVGYLFLMLYPMFRLIIDQFADFQLKRIAVANTAFLIVLALFFSVLFYLKIKKPV